MVPVLSDPVGLERLPAGLWLCTGMWDFPQSITGLETYVVLKWVVVGVLCFFFSCQSELTLTPDMIQLLARAFL